MEEFVEIFFPIQSPHKVFHRKLKVADVLTLKMRIFGLRYNVDPKICPNFRIFFHLLHRIGEEVDNLQFFQWDYFIFHHRGVKFITSFFAEYRKLHEVIEGRVHRHYFINFIQVDDESKPHHLVDNLIVANRAVVFGYDV